MNTSKGSIIENKQPIPVGSEANGTPYQAMLENLQGNILNGHGRDYSVHIFVRFPRPASPEDTETAGKVRSWIAEFGRTWVTSAAAQFAASEAREIYKNATSNGQTDEAAGLAASDQTEDPPLDAAKTCPNPAMKEPPDGGVFTHIAFAAPAFLPTEKGGLALGAVPQEANLQNRSEKVFEAGMKTRWEILFDTSVIEWDAGFRNGIDAMIIVADDAPNRMIEVEQHVIASLVAIGATICTVERGHTLWKKFPLSRGAAAHGIPIEHFGYADGVSQPIFTKSQFDDYLKKNPKVKLPPGVSESADGMIWDPVAALNLVLIPDPNTEEESSFGSFLVFRKLEQNLRGFRQAEQEMAQRLNVSRPLAGAMAVGRFKDGTTLVLEPGNNSEKVTNNFDYDGEPGGLTCPFHAHVRKSNPRLESVGSFAASAAVERGHRIARRGVPYGGELNDSENLAELPTGGIGLLFMCYQSDLWEQFEFIQRFWCNNPVFLEQGKAGPGAANYPGGTGIDAVVGQTQPGLFDPAINIPPTPPQNWPAGWGRPTTKVDCPVFAEFVKLKGGEYFFSPSMSFLLKLDS